MVEKNFFDIIKRTILKIDLKLNKVNNTGIFFAPEIFIVFKIGMEIQKKSEKIFGNNLIWERERIIESKIEKSIFDIILTQNNQPKIVVEFKIINKAEEYEKDIQKLSNLNQQIERYFCAIVDVNDEKNDKRINCLKENDKGKIVNEYSFKTNNRLNKSVTCKIILFKINSI